MASQPGGENPYQPPASETYGAPPQPKGGGKYAPCPQCRHNDAKRVGWTLWGGALGPWMFTHVKCTACGAKFNGKTGQSNTTAIAIYLGISFAIGFVVFGMIACAGAVG